MKIQKFVGDNPTSIDWNDYVQSIYFNLGEKAAKTVVHFAVDIKAGIGFLSLGRPDYTNGLIVDEAIEAVIQSLYPEEYLEDLRELMIVRAFCIETSDCEAISEWVYSRFGDSPFYIWVNGQMVGGVCFPQEPASDETMYPLPETLPRELTSN